MAKKYSEQELADARRGAPAPPIIGDWCFQWPEEIGEHQTNCSVEILKTKTPPSEHEVNKIEAYKKLVAISDFLPLATRVEMTKSIPNIQGFMLEKHCKLMLGELCNRCGVNLANDASIVVNNSKPVEEDNVLMQRIKRDKKQLEHWWDYQLKLEEEYCEKKERKAYKKYKTKYIDAINNILGAIGYAVISEKEIIPREIKDGDVTIVELYTKASSVADEGKSTGISIGIDNSKIKQIQNENQNQRNLQ